MDNNQFTPNEQNSVPQGQPETTPNFYNPQFQAPVQPQPVKKKLDIFGLIGMICGILAVLLACCCAWLALPLGIGGIVLAIVGRAKNGGKFSGLAIAGLICGALGTLTSLAVIVMPFIMAMLGSGSANSGFSEIIEDIVNDLT